MKYLIILMKGTYKFNLFCSAIRSYLRDDLQNQSISKIALVLVTENSSRQWTDDVIVDTGVRRFRVAGGNSVSWRHRCLCVFFNGDFRFDEPGGLRLMEKGKTPDPKNKDFLNIIPTPLNKPTENSDRNNYNYFFMAKGTFLLWEFLLLEIHFYPS